MMVDYLICFRRNSEIITGIMPKIVFPLDRHKEIFFECKIVNIFLSMVLKMSFGCSISGLVETVLLSTHRATDKDLGKLVFTTRLFSQIVFSEFLIVLTIFFLTVHYLTFKTNWTLQWPHLPFI